MPQWSIKQVHVSQRMKLQTNLLLGVRKIRCPHSQCRDMDLLSLAAGIRCWQANQLLYNLNIPLRNLIIIYCTCTLWCGEYNVLFQPNTIKRNFHLIKIPQYTLLNFFLLLTLKNKISWGYMYKPDIVVNGW